MTVWPLFLLSMRALNSHAAPLLDEYELVDLPELPSLDTGLSDLLPFRQKRDVDSQYGLVHRDIRYVEDEEEDFLVANSNSSFYS